MAAPVFSAVQWVLQVTNWLHYTTLFYIMQPRAGNWKILFPMLRQKSLPRGD